MYSENPQLVLECADSKIMQSNFLTNPSNNSLPHDTVNSLAHAHNNSAIGY